MEWLIAHWWQLAPTILGVIVAPRTIKALRHLWTLQTKYDNAMEKIAYLTGRNADLKVDVDYYKKLRADSDSSTPNRSIPPRTPTRDL